MRRRGQAGVVALTSLVLLPLYALSIVLILKSDLLGGKLSGPSYPALLTFLAATFTTISTTIGLLITRAHNDRGHRRQALETATKGLELLSVGTAYAPKAQVAGALAVLVQLDHPVIAMRALRTAWLDGAVDPGTAAWLISEVYLIGTSESQVEAANLLASRAHLLCEGTDPQSAEFHWPSCIYDSWLPNLPFEARVRNVAAALKVLMSRNYKWWRMVGGHVWVLAILDEVIVADPDVDLRNEAARALGVLLLTIRSDVKGISWWRANTRNITLHTSRNRPWKDVATLRKHADIFEPNRQRIRSLLRLEPELLAWAQVADASVSSPRQARLRGQMLRHRIVNLRANLPRIQR